MRVIDGWGERVRVDCAGCIRSLAVVALVCIVLDGVPYYKPM